MQKGLVHIYTGKGKGKTSAAMGLVLRALGYDKNIYLMQFLKGRETGEKMYLEKIPEVTFRRSSDISKFFNQMNEDEKKDMETKIRNSWQEIINIATDNKYDIIILDEIMALITYKIIKIDEVKSLIKTKSENIELILTGRGAPEELIEAADYVTEMKKIKHPFSQNIPARKGIEF